MMYPPPSGPTLSPDQAAELDDTFLSSDPYAQASARIAMMLDWADQAEHTEPIPPAAELPATLRSYALRLGFIAPSVWKPSKSVRETQLAQDAFTLRHHLAEAVFRLAWAVLNDDGAANACLWARLSGSPTSLAEILSQVEGHLTAPSPKYFDGLVFTPTAVSAVTPQSDQGRALRTYFAWFKYANLLLQRNDIALNSVNNKVKHGLAVRARNDVRFDLLRSAVEGDSMTVAEANNPLAKIFEHPVLEALHEAPVSPRAKAPLEVSLVQVDTPRVLAEAQMLAMVYGAVFHTAAAAHFKARPILPEHVHPPQHPGLPVDGPMPPSGHDPVIGMRFPLTHPQTADQPARKQGLAFNDAFFGLNVESGPRTVTVVDDEGNVPTNG